MKNKREIKEYVWDCDFCGEEFKTKKESDKHELTCSKNPKNNEIVFRIKKPSSGTIFGWASLFILLYFIVYVVANANAQNNGLPIRDLLQPQKWFSSEVEKVITPIPTPTLGISPTPTVKTKKIVQPTQNAVETDPIIDCVSSYPNCNGSSIKARRSQCSKIYCCGFSDNTWALYPSEEKCNEARNGIKANNPQNNTNYNQEVAKIDCSFNYGEDKYDYGMLTYEECTAKSRAYFDQKKKELGPTPEPGHLERAIQEMYDISHPTIVYPQANPIDGSIHIDNTPTPAVPYGYSN